MTHKSQTVETVQVSMDGQLAKCDDGMLFSCKKDTVTCSYVMDPEDIMLSEMSHHSNTNAARVH